MKWAQRPVRSFSAQTAMQNSRLAGLRSATWVSVAAACLLLGVFLLFWRGAMPLEGLIREFARMDAGKEVSPLASSPVTLRRYYSLSAGTAILIAGLLMLVWSVWARLNQETRSLLHGLAVTLATSCSLMIYLFRMKFEGPWMPIGVVMRNPSALPIFGHRLLFVWIAKAVQSAVPGLSDVRSFYVSQGVAIVLTVYALGEWSAQHIGRAFSWIGQVIGIVMISTCFSYYNFYDIGTVFFTTCGVIAIYARRYWWLVPVVTVGTLNYEGVLLLIPLAAFAAYGQDPLRKWLPASAASILGYSAVRYAMQAAIPFSRQVDWRIWSNMTEPFLYRSQMAYSVMALGGWYAVGLMSFRSCDLRLKRLTLLFPLLLTVTFLFGQLHEPRQFDAFIPIVVAMIVSALRRRIEIEACLK